MGNLLTRIKDSISADIHGLLDEKEQKNPMAALNHYLRQSEQETEKVRKLVERQHRLKEEFIREYEQARRLAEKRARQAEIAQKAGETSMYEFALNEQREYENRAERLLASREDAIRQLDDLEQKYETMKHKLKDMQVKRMELMGRENVARAHHQMNRVIEENGENSYSRFADLDRYMDEVEQKVNRAYYHHTFDSKIARLEKEMQEQEKGMAN
ncbi:PspA/IM30 family protein [Thalassobacillus hwangdonensis]|uniref:PspA/IM30 family protein n=1 Tax=Thalassobacillus hwangdonensis TaxID=546108 RepID=A0ABW3L5D2_9BACI